MCVYVCAKDGNREGCWSFELGKEMEGGLRGRPGWEGGGGATSIHQQVTLPSLHPPTNTSLHLSCLTFINLTAAKPPPLPLPAPLPLRPRESLLPLYPLLPLPPPNFLPLSFYLLPATAHFSLYYFSPSVSSLSKLPLSYTTLHFFLLSYLLPPIH